MSQVPGVLDSIAVERKRRMDGRETPDGHARTLWHRSLKSPAAAGHVDRLEAAAEYAMALPYRHEGLSSEIYAAHPLRVAALSLLAGTAAGADVGVVGLLHNVLEVSDVNETDIARRFGDAVREQVVNLTVNRALQWNADYKRAYYRTLNAGPVEARVVKVFDKLDNLYLLGLNDDVDVKTRYLREIIEHVVPMAERDVPKAAPYFAALVNETILAEKLDLPAV